jgi:hypothetical protein
MRRMHTISLNNTYFYTHTLISAYVLHICSPVLLYRVFALTEPSGHSEVTEHVMWSRPILSLTTNPSTRGTGVGFSRVAT